jgi:hypothetical protein
MPKSKKRKKKSAGGSLKKPQKKPLDKWVRFQAKANSAGEVKIEFDREGKWASDEAINGSMVSYDAYPRASGKHKIVTQTPGQDRSAFKSLKENIEANYDSIASIDTNDYDLNGRRLAISAAFGTGPVLKPQRTTLEAKQLPAFVVEKIDPSLNSEVIGWHLFFMHVLPLLKCGASNRLALVVDSELGMHDAINHRNSPYYLNHILPDHVDLIYASSDTGTDLPNKLIKACDRSSRDIFRRIESGEIEIPSKLANGNKDFGGYATINFDQSPYKV